MDEREYFNATNPCLARPDRHVRRGRAPHDAVVVRRSVLRRVLAKLARR